MDKVRKIDMTIRFTIKQISKLGFIVVSILMAIMLASALISNHITGYNQTDDFGIDLKNFSISELTDQQIISVSARSSSYMGGGSKTGESTGVEGFHYSDVDKDSVRRFAKKIVGLTTLMTAKVVSGTVTFNIDAELASGVAEIVVIKDNEIVDRAPLGDMVLTYEVSEESVFYVKLLCEDAKIDIRITRSISE